MKTNLHAIVSLSLGTLFWLYTKSLFAGILLFIFGYLIDADHVIEYIIHYGWKDFSLRRLNLICEQTGRQEGELRFKKIYLIFHVTELAMLLWIVCIYTKNIYLLAAAIGYSVHIIMDFMGNPIYPSSYFLIWRAAKDFNSNRLIRKGSNK